MFVVPHGVYVDKNGNVWATDNSGKDGKGQQVIEFSPEGKVLDEAGEGRRRRGRSGHVQSAGRRWWWPRMEISSSRTGTPSGSGNARIVKFSKDGNSLSNGASTVRDRANLRCRMVSPSIPRDDICRRPWQQASPLDFRSGWKISRPVDAIWRAQWSIYRLEMTCSTWRTPCRRRMTPKRPAYNPGFEQGIRVGSAKDGKGNGITSRFHPQQA